MQIVEILLWIVGAFITISWLYGIRSYISTGRGVTQQMVNQTMTFALSLIVVPLLGLSPFHLLWMFPAGLVLGALPRVSFSLLSIPGKMFGAICCIGLARV